MRAPTLNAKHLLVAKDSDGNDMTAEILGFAEAIGLERVVPGRYSILLLVQLYARMLSGQQNPAKIMDEIKALEGNCVNSRSKPASIFSRGKHLKGLWHKHYLEDGVPSIARNIKKGLVKYGVPKLARLVADAEESGEERYFSEQDVTEIVQDAVFGNWKRLVTESALTGEWIVFAKNKGQNYYLCLGRHASGDHFLREQIEKVCVHEFSFLNEILE